MKKQKSKTTKTIIGYASPDWNKYFSYYCGALDYPFVCKEPNNTFKKWEKVSVTVEETK